MSRTVYYPYKKSPTEYFVIELTSSSVGGIITDPKLVDDTRDDYSVGYIDVILDVDGNPSYDGKVENIRKYTFNFINKSFEPTFDDTTTTKEIIYKAGENSYFKLIFTETNNYIVRKIIPKVDTVPVQGEVGGSWDKDKTSLVQKQEDYFERSTPPDPSASPIDDKVYEEIDAKSYRLTVFGSYERALSEARLVIFPPPDKNPEDIPPNPTDEDKYLYLIPGYPAGRIDAMVGTYRYYFPNGNLKKEEIWENFSGLERKSVLNGEYFEYYQNGNRKVEAGFNGGRMNGTYREYHENGNLRTKSTLILGKLEGLLYQFDSLGNRTYIAKFVNGDLKNSYALDYTRI